MLILDWMVGWLEEWIPLRQGYGGQVEWTDEMGNTRSSNHPFIQSSNPADGRNRIFDWLVGPSLQAYATTGMAPYGLRVISAKSKRLR